MANPEHVKILNQGAASWNSWREANSGIVPDLSRYIFSYPIDDCPNLNGINLSYADLSGAHIDGPDRDWPGWTAPTFTDANLKLANMRGISTFRTGFDNADLTGADLSEADIRSTRFERANLNHALFRKAKLNSVNFDGAKLDSTNFEGASLSNVRIPNVELWQPKLNADTQANSIAITAENEATIAVDDLEIAQLISLLLNTDKLRRLLDISTERMVLILGRFTEERKKILDVIRAELRKRGFIAIIFDFSGPTRRNITETISLLAHLSRFVVADITDPKSIPQELHAVIPHLPSVAFQPILQKGAKEYSMFEHFRHYPWVLPIFQYENQGHLLSSIESQVITPAIAKSDEIIGQRDQPS